MIQHPRIVIPIVLFLAVITAGIGYSVYRAHAFELITTSLINDANLKAYYQLEASGTDQKGNYNVTLYNTPTFVPASWGNGMDLGTSNTNKYAEIGNNMGITNGAITISLWVKLNTEVDGTSQSFGLAGLGNSRTYNEYWIDYEYNSGTRRVQFRRSRQMVNQAVQYYNIALGTSQWHHIVLTYDGTTLYGYVDSHKTEGVAASGNGTSSVYNHFTIGAHNELGPQFYASATFDDVAVFNRALTDQEVGSLYVADTLKLAALRTADRSISSSATAQADDQLTLSLAHRTYTIEGIIFAKSTNASPGIKFGFSATSASSLAIGYMALSDSVQSGGMLTAAGTTAVVPATANAAIPIRISGTVDMSQAGNLIFEWAQSVSDDDAMTVMKGSYLRATEIQ
jgi:hypothetical protein